MNKVAKKFLFIFAAFVFLGSIQGVYGAFLYKNYIIRQDRGSDILCDPYIVQRNDWVLKIFQRRGQIADQDFPEFLKIFGRLNPKIENANKILPGQHILIPLKKLPKGSLPGQSTGMVTIPFITVSNIPDMVKENSHTYTVQPGDHVSGIIGKAYDQSSRLSYNEAIQLFKLVNPSVTDIDRIYPGQVLVVPDRTMGNKELYDTLFSNAGALLNPDASPTQPISPSPEVTPGTPENLFKNSSFVTVAGVLDAKLKYQGKFSLPRENQEDLIIDLSKYPIMEMQNNSRVLLSEGKDFPVEDQALIQNHWKGLQFVTLPPASGFEQVMDAVMDVASSAEPYQNLVFTNYGITVSISGKWMVKAQTAMGSTDATQNPPYTFISITHATDKPVSNAIKRYLAEYNVAIKEITPTGETLDPTFSVPSENVSPIMNKTLLDTTDPKTFIRTFTKAMNLQYTENTDISFPYAGIQVNAVSNLITTPDGKQILVDFGDLYGDATASIEHTGLGVLQLSPPLKAEIIISSLFKKLKVNYTQLSDMKAVDRQGSLEVTLTIPGFTYKTHSGTVYLITSAQLSDPLADFLKEEGYEVIEFFNTDFSLETSNRISSLQPLKHPQIQMGQTVDLC